MKREYERAARRANPRRYRGYELKKHYGITSDEYERRVLEQGGKCAICLGPPTDQGLCVDHVHGSKRIRGLLCTRCNAGIGMFLDDPARLSAAIVYLDRHATKDGE